MRLKSIKLAGFKSFVDPTTVNFPGNLCAVVGPNGCGKSNIIDAVRWVMGESSAKHLRGESMTDVIFNGSGGRKPVGQASIELVFDNSDSSLGGEYAAYSEISIRRKVTRDGQSNYYLNGNKCRRRDITDIFLGTGLGPRSYAIIEQGMISNLIEARPEELRVFIEEAAGISKYKERRRDTENRMRRTQENLERLTDIREELGRQLQRLERQAQAAEKYAEFKKEERLVRAQLQALRWREMNAEVESRQALINRQELDVEALVTERASGDTALEKLRLQYTGESDSFNAVQGEYYAIGAEVARTEQSIEHVRQRARELRQDIEQTERNYAESEKHLRDDRERAQGWVSELEEIVPTLEGLRVEEEQSAAVLREAEEVMTHWQTRWDEFNHRAAQPQRESEVQQSRIQHLEQVLRRLAERLERLDAERRELASSSPGEDQLALLSEQLAEMELVASARQQEMDDLGLRIDETRKSYQSAGKALGEVREQLQALKGRQSSLEALQQAALEDTGEEKQWLDRHQLQGAQRLAEALSVTPGWEVAVEAVLGGNLQAVCVDTIDPLASSLAGLPKGELTLVDGVINAVDDATMTGHPWLADCVQDGRARSLLAGILAVESLDQALALRPELNAGQSVVTRDGVWLGRNWVKVARGKNATEGVLRRKQELEQLSEQISILLGRADELADEQARLEQSLTEYERQREALGRTMAEQQREYAELRSQVSASRMQIEQHRERHSRIDDELADIRQQQRSEQESLSEARMLLEQALDAMEQDTQQREVLLTERDHTRNQLDGARQRARHTRDKVHELTLREQSLSTQLESVRESIGRLEVQVARLQERREQLQATVSIDEDPSEELAAQLEEQLERRLVAEQKMADARRRLEEVEHAMRDREKRRAQLESQLLDKRTELEQTRLQTQDIRTRCKTIVEQIVDQGFDVSALLAELGEGADPAQWEESLERIAARIQRLGAINLAAIEEFKTESERKAYLDAQHQELTEALETLENAIRKIDRETRTRFKETFDQINKSLEELFPKVFGGGHAYLELTGDDLLDTGVTIMARPPGKKNTTIHLLSGGEKALTAIALVFSIFRLNPAPFCMLDEVDAPLDDANVARYARMVEEMSERVQFIYITHNKIAMEMAHQLMGVTMHEPGVSRLVTVDVDKAAELAEA
ncbi:MAG: chromosome segregation protein SMC [Porticoccaceae bacterium]|nr:chromosome segregation protein SMC [Porticoccaceae bacterium]